MQLSAGAKRLLVYWGNIQNAVTLRATTAQLWESVRNIATRQGIELKGVSAIDMGQLRSVAASQRDTLEAFQRLGPSDVITAAHLGTDLSARPQAAQDLAQRWILRFEHDVSIGGQLETLWRSSVIDSNFPVTAGDARDQAEQDAQAMADDYGVTHIGVGRIQISAV